jgi:hypothetical protein
MPARVVAGARFTRKVATGPYRPATRLKAHYDEGTES